MMLKTAIRVAWLFGAALLLRPAAGQTPNFAFSYRSSVNPTTVSVAPTGTIQFSSASLGTTNTVTFIISNRGDAMWTIAEFSVSGGPFQMASGVVAEISPGEDRLYGLSFTPQARGVADGILNIRLTSGSRSLSVTFFLTGTGLAADLISSYILTAEGNQIILGARDTINFPPTLVAQSSTGTVIISNRGNGPGTVNRVVLTGGAFRVSGLPLLPTQIAAEREIRFTLIFAPTAQETAAGSLRIEFAQDVLTVNLSGQGIGPTLVFESVSGSASTAIAPNGTLALPPASVGSSSSVTLRVRNTGNAEGRISAIAVSGTGFQLANVPFLPAVVASAEAVTFTIIFSPAQSGPAEGRLRIDNTVINLTGTGLGSALSLAVRQGTTVAPLPPNGTVTFPNTPVGGKTTAVIQISNDGNTDSTINSISLTGDSFLLASLPELPVVLSPGQGVEFTITFIPEALGSASGIVRIEGQRVNLVGVGVPPPALPAVLFSGIGDSAEPAQQPSLGLSLGAPYPLDIFGRLTISFTPEAFIDDPAIQFATGGRSISFSIPANTTRAIFGQDAAQVQLQTGTVAGTISIGATFSTGAVNLTPAPAPVKTITIPASAPRLRSAQIGSRTATSFEVILTGFSTLRSVTQVALQFTPSPGAALQTTTLTVDVDTPFTAWYRGSGSTQFGSQFSAVIIIGVTGDINAVQSVAATAANQRGTSAPVSANLR